MKTVEMEYHEDRKTLQVLCEMYGIDIGDFLPDLPYRSERYKGYRIGNRVLELRTRQPEKPIFQKMGLYRYDPREGLSRYDMSMVRAICKSRDVEIGSFVSNPPKPGEKYENKPIGTWLRHMRFDYPNQPLLLAMGLYASVRDYSKRLEPETAIARLSDWANVSVGAWIPELPEVGQKFGVWNIGSWVARVRSGEIEYNPTYEQIGLYRNETPEELYLKRLSMLTEYLDNLPGYVKAVPKNTIYKGYRLGRMVQKAKLAYKDHGEIDPELEKLGVYDEEHASERSKADSTS